jgi:MFS family permease
VCKSRTVSLVALLTSATLAMLLAAQMSLACTDKIAVPVADGVMSAMPGMDMAAVRAPVMVCPIVLVLMVASALLTAFAATLLWRDPHRALAQRDIMQTLARLPLARTVGSVALAGTSAVGAMLWLERTGPPALPVCAMLAMLLFGSALAVTLCAIVAGRIAIAFGRRLILAIAAAIARASDARSPHAHQLVPVVAAVHAVPLLAAGRGLRAPPSFVR